MIYLIVGVDRHALTPWHENVAAGDVCAARHTACARARGHGVELVVAAIIGPNSKLLPDPAPGIADAVAAPVAAPSRAA